jgi:hypothetical protein
MNDFILNKYSIRLKSKKVNMRAASFLGIEMATQWSAAGLLRSPLHQLGGRGKKEGGKDRRALRLRSTSFEERCA